MYQKVRQNPGSHAPYKIKNSAFMLKMEAPQRNNRVPATKKTQQSLAERSALALINIINIKKIFALFALKKSSIIHHLSLIFTPSLRIFSLAGRRTMYRKVRRNPGSLAPYKITNSAFMLKMEAPQRSNRVPATKKHSSP
ncbi:hypothetical protein SAMN05660493_00732 [Epilithonimonas bovis DSM 19482]|uniref:Uncharacterized protein n=1 Tax=Epilithonimonas bovis DSM 19482 TaxID=1121284 RepID=A0A1U7PW45_9FLAO|nr:hypothetical protein [Epilithonimonas bovis]SIT96060.1 hypothetical protein SAMN05660493_00732 [Epilithonimonas bovis DSM 19482]